MSSKDHEGFDLYDQDFYEWQVSGSLNSARILTKHLIGLYPIKSVLDAGCGRGAWLKAWGECGVQTRIGMDGAWNSQQNMIDPGIEFRPADFIKPVTVDQRVDLAMSLEVAEHIPETSADNFVTTLTTSADVVLFGAAYYLQGGTGHINEQLPSYWADKFKLQGYAAFDVIRPSFWSDSRVEWWYLQNTFLYVNRKSPAYQAIKAQGFRELEDLTFLDVRHPIADTIMRKLKPWVEAKLKQYLPSSLTKTS